MMNSTTREDASHSNLALLLTYMYVDIKKTSKFGAEIILYAGVSPTLQYALAGRQGTMFSLVPRLHSPAFYRTMYDKKLGSGVWERGWQRYLLSYNSPGAYECHQVAVHALLNSHTEKFSDPKFEISSVLHEFHSMLLQKLVFLNY